MSSRPLRVLVVDDEPYARATLVKLLADARDVELVGECANGEEALESVRALTPDLVFLDVEMPACDGLSFLDALPEEARPAVVFTTAHDRYATRAFDEQAVDYLLKPFSDERFHVALERAVERFRSAPAPRRPESLKRLSIHREGRIELVDVADVEWIQSADQYVRIHTGESEHLMRQSMSELERALDPARFARVHRSAIVALDRVTRLETAGRGTGRVLLASGTWVPVSRSRVAAVRRLLG